MQKSNKCEDFEVRFCCPKIESTSRAALFTAQHSKRKSRNCTDTTLPILPTRFEPRKLNRQFKKSGLTKIIALFISISLELNYLNFARRKNNQIEIININPIQASLS